MTPSVLLGAATLLVAASTADCRAVSINNTWFLPQEGFPVFYRYFRDLITWYEADAVCQFHHANLVTVDSSEQFDTSRAFLKELDVVSNVWIGLKRGKKEGRFSWTSMNPMELHPTGGYFMEAPPVVDTPLCVATDPAHDFRWHSFNCGGPEVATFICELPVPRWANSPDGCMLTSLPSLTVTFLPEQAAVELTSDCGLDGTRRIACKGQANRDEMMRQLSCAAEDAGDSTTVQTSGGTTGPIQPWTAYEPPTRHRRDASQTAAPQDASTQAYDSSSQPTDPPPSQTRLMGVTEKSDLDQKTSQNVRVAATTASLVGTGNSALVSDLISTFTSETTPESLLTTGHEVHPTTIGMKNATDTDPESTGTPYPIAIANNATDVNKTRIQSEINMTVEVNEDRKQQEDPLQEASETHEEHSWTELPSEDTMEVLEAEPEAPARPNRGRRLTRPQGRSFYPYILNRVLG